MELFFQVYVKSTIFFCVNEGWFPQLDITDQHEHKTDSVCEELHMHDNDHQNILLRNDVLAGLQYRTILICQ